MQEQNELSEKLAQISYDSEDCLNVIDMSCLDVVWWRYTELFLKHFAEVSKVIESCHGGSLSHIVRNGGYPEVVASRQLVRSYLDTLFDSIVWKDVAKRHNVRLTQ